MRLSATIAELKEILDEAKWQSLPRGWTKDSLKKFWDSLTGDAQHKVTACMDKMKGKLDDPGAFCASLKDKVTGSTAWRGEKE
jgi:hypothetical protein